MFITWSKSLWGPILWNILHSFSINNNLKITNEMKKKYYIFYTSVAYIIPCLVCSDDYSNIIYNMYPIEENKINRIYIKKWLYTVHNIINKKLNKPKYSYKNLKKDHTEIKNKESFALISAIYKKFDYEMMSFYKYDQIYNFFLNFCLLYPDKKIKKDLKKLVNTDSFKLILTPKEFNIWFCYNLENMKKIFINDE